MSNKTEVKRDANGQLLPGSQPLNPAGRPKGSSNKVTVDVAATAAEMRCDPIKILCLIANGDEEELYLKPGSIRLNQRVDACKELLKYMAPKPSADNKDADAGKGIVYIQVPGLDHNTLPLLNGATEMPDGSIIDQEGNLLRAAKDENIPDA